MPDITLYRLYNWAHRTGSSYGLTSGHQLLAAALVEHANETQFFTLAGFDLEDLGAYCGLSPERTSEVFADLVRDGWIETLAASEGRYRINTGRYRTVEGQQVYALHPAATTPIHTTKSKELAA